MTPGSEIELRPHELRPSFPDVPPKPTPVPGVVGQDRAREAVAFALAMDAAGYNVAVSGPAASGRHALVVELVRGAAAGRPPGDDWVYLHNFEDPRRPRAAKLAAGSARQLAHALDGLVTACRDALPTAFASEGYERRVQQALAPVLEARNRTIEMLQNTASALGFAVNATPAGFLASPLRADGNPMEAQEYMKLPPEIRQPIEERGERVQEALNATLRQLRQLDLRAHAAVADVDRETALSVVEPEIQQVRAAFGEAGLGPHLDALQADILEHLEVFKRFAGHDDALPPQLLQQFQGERDAILHHYQANVFVTREPGTGAAIVEEAQPTYHNVFGRVEFENRMGTLTTDFTQIRAGAIHRANGGYLVVQAEELLADPQAWPKLKRTLQSGEIRFDDAPPGLVLPVAGLAPEGIPLSLKVILVGGPFVFAVLDALDRDFGQLFKVRAEFEPDMPASGATIETYAGFVVRVCDECGLLPFGPGATEEVLRFGARMADRRDRLTARLGVVADLCKEANYFAVAAGAREVTGEHVLEALAARTRRSGLVPDRIRELIAEKTLRVETTGAVVGQVNGLAVVVAGGNAFGLPMRITCRTGAGRGGVVDIERETERSGSIHTKGVLVLQGYLAGMFGADDPLAFNASLTFEQSYDEVEGDSASSAELCAILASLAGLPVRQDLAVTGSVDQFGNVQAVGGVTQKVEGFFDVCAAGGHTGTQGVIIPRANAINLNLRADIVEAVENGRFRVFAVHRIEESIELLTGVAAGEPRPGSRFPPGSVFGRVAARLRTLRQHAAESTPRPRG